MLFFVFVFKNALLCSRGVIVSNIVFSTSKGALVGCPRSGTSGRCMMPRNARMVNGETFSDTGCLGALALPFDLGRVKSCTLKTSGLMSVI